MAAAAVGVVGAAAATANVAGAPSSPLATIPFPSPPDGAASAGGFPSLCDLQCNLLGGPSPTVTVWGIPVSVSSTVCADLLDTRAWQRVGPGGEWVDERNASIADATREVIIKRIVRGLGSPTGGAVGSNVRYAPNRDALPVSCAAAGARREPIEGGRARGAANPVPRWGSLLGGGPDGGGSQRLAYEADIVRAFTLKRNSIYGSVERVTSCYAVLGVTGVTLGVCADARCARVVSLDNTRRSRREVPGPCPAVEGGPSTCHLYGVPLLTYVGTDEVERPVSMADRNLLSLGRGLLANSRWLGPATPTYDLHAAVAGVGAVDRTSYEWNLNGSGVRQRAPGEEASFTFPTGPPWATPWLRRVATIFCSGGLPRLSSTRRSATGSGGTTRTQCPTSLAPYTPSAHLGR